MPPFTLELLFTIAGIGSASGLICDRDTLWMIGDNSGFLYEYHTLDSKRTVHSLFENASANIPKKTKPDFEAMTLDDRSIYVFGSGSTANRNLMVQFDRQTRQAQTHDLTSLYQAMQQTAAIGTQAFNLEGVAGHENIWYFFQRGNGQSANNGIFTVTMLDWQHGFDIQYQPIALPEINGVRAGFTDAVTVGDRLYFLASAEDTNSTYLDGTVTGSAIGWIDPKKMTVGQTILISDRHKFEGLSLRSQNTESLTFWLCEDNDTDVLESSLFALTIKK